MHQPGDALGNGRSDSVPPGHLGSASERPQAPTDPADAAKVSVGSIAWFRSGELTGPRRWDMLLAK